MLVQKILNMTNEEIIKSISENNIDYVIERWRTFNNFCDIYQDAARESGEDEYFNVNEYIELIKNMY